MKNVKKLFLATVLTFSLGAFAVGAYASLAGSASQIVDTSGQPNEWDVGFAGSATQLADTSGQPNEWDVG